MHHLFELIEIINLSSCVWDNSTVTQLEQGINMVWESLWEVRAFNNTQKKSQHLLCWDPETPDDILTGNETNTLDSKQRYAKMSPNACSVSSLLCQVRNSLPWCQLLSAVTIYCWYLTRHWRTPVDKLKPFCYELILFLNNMLTNTMNKTINYCDSA